MLFVLIVIEIEKLLLCGLVQENNFAKVRFTAQNNCGGLLMESKVLTIR